MRPIVAFAKTPIWDHADRKTQTAFKEPLEKLGDDCQDLPLLEPFDHLVKMHFDTMNPDMEKKLAPYYDRGKNKTTKNVCEMIEDAQKISAVDYSTAVDGQDLMPTSIIMT
jgi:hypothetical protein